MSADDFYAGTSSNRPDHDEKLPDKSWTPGEKLIAIKDDGDVTIFPDLECDGVELMSNWISIDEAHAIPRGEWR